MARKSSRSSAITNDALWPSRSKSKFSKTNLSAYDQEVPNLIHLLVTSDEFFEII